MTVMKGLSQRLTLEELRHRKEHATVAVELVDCEDVRVRQRRHRACLALEAGPRFGVTREIGREDLDCDLAAEPLVACSVDLSHSARAETLDHFVGAETATRLERTRKRSRDR